MTDPMPPEGRKIVHDLARVSALAQTDAIVCAVMHAGGSVVDALEALAKEKQRLLGELVELQGQVGRRYRLPNGQILVHRPPEDVLPLTDLSLMPFYPGSDPKRSLDTITLMGIEYVRKEARHEREQPGRQ